MAPALQRTTRSLLAGAAFLAGLMTVTAQEPPVSVIPAPESVIGFPPCTDRHLATYEQIADYFRALDTASRRMSLVDIGPTVEGRRQLMAVISSEENLARQDHFREIAARLARARGLSDDEARNLAADGRAVVWIDFGLHSSEVAHAQAAPLLAYRVVSEETPEARFIRDNVILLLVPNMNPDGTTLMANWYMDHRGTPLDGSPPPTLYHRYAGHDNNRDWFMFNLQESQNVARQLYAEWFPQIVQNHHQTAPFPARIFIPPFAAPANPHIPARVLRGIDLVGAAMQARLDREGRTGAISSVQFDTWWNGGMRTAPYFHNMIGILTETAHSSPVPESIDPSTFPATFANGTSTREASPTYPRPYAGGTWRMRDSCDLIVETSWAVLDVGAERRRDWLFDIFQMGRDAIRSGADEWHVVPSDQWDEAASRRMINALLRGGIEVRRARQGFTVNGRVFGPGTFVIPGAQPFVAHVRDLMQPQVYPGRRRLADGRPEPPYDLTGWTLPMQMGVHVERIDGPLDVELEAVEVAAPRTRDLERADTDWLAIDPRSSDAVTIVNRLLTLGTAVWRAPHPMPVGDRTWPSGVFVVRRDAAAEGILRDATGTLGLPVRAVNLSTATLLRLERPRIGLYRAWGGNPDEGWTRWLLERHEFGFTTLEDAEVRSAGLRQHFDVVILPQASYDEMIAGFPGARPPAASGMTLEGAANLAAFVADGGTLIAFDTASDLPIQILETGVRNLAAAADPTEFFVPGTLVRLVVDPDHPLGYGLPPRAVAFYAHGPIFELLRRDGERFGPTPAPMSPVGLTVAAEFARQDLLASGWLLGGSILAGRPAVVEMSHGRGRAVLIGFRPQHRGQTDQTFKFVFNAIFRGMSAPDGARPGAVFHR